MERHVFETIGMREAEDSRITRGLINLIPSEELEFDYTVHDSESSKHIRRSRTGRAMYVARASNVRPLSPALMPLATDNRLFAETVMFNGLEREIWEPYLYAAMPRGGIYELPKPSQMTRPAILLPGLGSFYYHFLFDVIGALLTVPRADWTDRIAIFSQAPNFGPVRAWQREILSMIGAGQVHAFEGFANHVFSDAIVCCYPSQDNAVPPSVVRLLRDNLALPGGRPEPSQRVFFTRSGSRAMDQEDYKLIISLAEQYGFRCVDPVQLSVRGQRQLLQNCSVFMCEAGSGLANLLFLPEGAKTITLGTKITFKDYFCPIATALNLETHVVLSDVKRMFPRHQFLWSNFTPSISSSALERCLIALDSQE